MNAVIIPILPAVHLKHILYATDLSEASRDALPVVKALAQRYDSQVYAAHVCQPLPYSVAGPNAIFAMERRHLRDAENALHEFLSAQETSGMKVMPVVKSGNTVAELRRMTHDYHIDLAVLSTHGYSGIRRLVLGSTAEELFRGLPCPVLTVGPNASRKFLGRTGIKEILFPTDLSFESGAVFPLVAALAAEYAARITLLHVVPGAVRRQGSMEGSIKLRGTIERMFCHRIDPRCDARIMLEYGDPAEEILALAHAGCSDLIAFGVRPAVEFSAHFRNTVAYNVLLRAECPVLTAHGGAAW